MLDSLHSQTILATPPAASRPMECKQTYYVCLHSIGPYYGERTHTFTWSDRTAFVQLLAELVMQLS